MFEARNKATSSADKSASLPDMVNRVPEAPLREPWYSSDSKLPRTYWNIFKGSWSRLAARVPVGRGAPSGGRSATGANWNFGWPGLQAFEILVDLFCFDSISTLHSLSQEAGYGSL